uniref:Uncharacterized protein n=1 Tax=Salix viminalis TaxID=40686 RepID=A0A6N2M1F8_SALVM
MGVDIQGKLRIALGAVKDHASIGKAMIHGHHEGEIFPHRDSPGSVHFLAERISRRLARPEITWLPQDPLSDSSSPSWRQRCFEQQLRNAHVSGHLQMSTRCFSGTFQILPEARACMSQVISISVHDEKSIDMCQEIAEMSSVHR